MSLDGYKACDTLEEVAQYAVERVGGSGSPWVANFDIKVTFPVDLLARPGLKDAAAKAELWQRVDCPDQLLFSHGQYLGAEGVSHIASELKAKPDSNRALASLIGQQHILGSGDNPLPSFLVIQCMIDGGILYVTVIYRALEVATFFRTNLEEIRMMANTVYQSNRTVREVALCIFATRAYVKEGMNALEKCEIDRIGQIALVTSHRDRLPSLLREKGRQSTYPVATGLENLLEAARSTGLAADNEIPGNGPQLVRGLERAIDDTLELKRLRQSASHHPDIAKIEERLRENLEALAKIIEKGAK